MNGKEEVSSDNNSHNHSQSKNRNKSDSNLESKYAIKTTMVRSLGFRVERDQDYSSDYYRGTGLSHRANGRDNRSLTMGLLCSLSRHLTTSGMSIRSLVH